MTYVIEFAPPMTGFENSFNTIRLGGAWAKRLQGGETVLLMDKPKCRIFGRAIVERIITGKLQEMANLHAAGNHNQKGLDPSGAPERQVAATIKRYGPQKVSQNSLCTVIYLKRLDDEKDPP